MKGEQDEKELAIKRAQLDSMRQAMEAVNQDSDIFSNAPSIDVSRKKGKIK